MGAVNLDFQRRRSGAPPVQPTQPTSSRDVLQMPGPVANARQQDAGSYASGGFPQMPRTGSGFGDFFRNETRGPSDSGGAFTGGNFQDWFMQAINGKPFNQQTLLDLEPLLQQSGSKLTPANSLGERTKIWDPTRNDWVRVGFGEGTPQWIYQNWGENGQPQGQPGQVFSDPATQEWEKLLRQLNERLQQPQPTYTDAQRDLMQTQAIDPLERQRQAMKQQKVQEYASMGHARSSGQLEQALQDVDRQFDQMKTGQQSQFALNQINREDQLFNSNEQRALAGLNLFGQIPQLADRRLAAAQGSLIPSNPYQLLSLQNQIHQQGQYQQNYNQQQDQQFWNWLGQMLANAFAGR
jgi:hypothetical protein